MPVFFCPACRSEHTLDPPGEGATRPCPKCSRAMHVIPVAPAHLARRHNVTYRQIPIRGDRLVMDAPSTMDDGDVARKKVILGEAISCAVDGVDRCLTSLGSGLPRERKIYARWFHNREHEASRDRSERPDWKNQVLRTFVNVGTALGGGSVTFAVATPDNAFANSDPNSPAFTWPPELNKIRGFQERAQGAATEADYVACVGKLPNLGVGSGIRIVLTDLFFSSPPLARASTVVHELTHKTSDTLDIAYGPWQCFNLAHQHPYKAVGNADNYAYYFEQVMGRSDLDTFTWDGAYQPPDGLV